MSPHLALVAVRDTTPVNALEAAGIRLDNARCKLDELNVADPASDAAAAADRAFVAALAAYKAELGRVAGCDVETIARRLA